MSSRRFLSLSCLQSFSLSRAQKCLKRKILLGKIFIVKPDRLRSEVCGLAGIVILHRGDAMPLDLTCELAHWIMVSCLRNDTKAKSNANAFHLLAFIGLF